MSVAAARLAAAALAASLVAGCALFAPRLETPQLSVQDIRMVEASLFEQRLEVRMKVRNPNDREIPVRGLDLEFELAGEPFATGVSAREFTVPALGEAEFDMRVTANAATAVLKMLRAGGERRETVDYVIRGKLRTQLGLLRTVPFEEKGSLDLKALLGGDGRERI